uniref:UL128 n=1 Tax=Strongyloides stercoralis TaxID=6248 RepID=A0A0K0DWS0_STRER
MIACFMTAVLMLQLLTSSSAYYTPITRHTPSLKYELCEIYPLEEYCSDIPENYILGLENGNRFRNFIILSDENDNIRRVTKRYTQKAKKEIVQAPNLDTLLRFGR